MQEARLVLRDVVDMPEIPVSRTVLGYDPSDDPFIPTVVDNYHFRKELVRDVSAFLNSPGGDALFISGPTGSGKTSGITQLAARLNWPMQQVTAHGRLEFADLVGMHTLQSSQQGETPTMSFMYGPLSLAMKCGHILLINEVDLIDPSELSGLNDVLEGRPLVLPQNGGEVIKPHPMFRVVVTGNSTGQGDATGLYQGVQAQNIAAMDRYRFIQVGYPDEVTELAILNKQVPNLPEEILKRCIQVANEVRKLFIGENGQGTLSCTMSTRTLVRWCKLAVAFRGATNAFDVALQQALLNRVSDAESTAIVRIAKDVYGDAWR